MLTVFDWSLEVMDTWVWTGLPGKRHFRFSGDGTWDKTHAPLSVADAAGLIE